VNGQHYIGMQKDKIAEVLKQQNPDFRIDNSTVNSTYHYLKFVDDVSEQTILFFLSANEECTYVRWMSDYANLNDITNLLNTQYKKAGENRWFYFNEGKRFTVALEEGEWYFTVNINQE
jgi:hypothetical protein